MDFATGICGCPLENTERLCRSRNDCDDTCVCVDNVEPNNIDGHCCGDNAWADEFGTGQCDCHPGVN